MTKPFLKYSPLAVRKSGLGRFKFLILFVIIGLTVVKNSGCSTSLFGGSNSVEAPVASAIKPLLKRLAIHPRVVLMDTDGKKSSIVHVTGGEGPYVFFLSDRQKIELSIMGSKSAKLTLNDDAKRQAPERNNIYAMDGNGDMVHATIILSKRAAAYDTLSGK